ncbi:MAG: C25 family cysteine peptidase, partial [candidate division KSB1 bacterium]|nr:C25 family cysteine peptidase [candidate division KSB1 bacterium]
MVFSGHKNATLLILLLTIPLLRARLSFAFSNSEVVETIESNPSRIILELKPYEINFDEIFVNSQRYELPRIEGYQWLAEPGKPRLPVKGILLGIPRKAAPTIQILESHFIPLGPKNLYPSPELILTEDEQGQHLTERFGLDKDFYSQNSFYPSKLVEITSISRLRHQWVARLEIHPLQYNPVTRELKKVDRLKVALLFEETQPSKEQPIKPETFTPFETIYKSLLHNYQTARSWRQPESSRYSTFDLKKKEMNWYRPNTIYYKLFVEEKGIYRLDVAYLDSIGIDVDSVDPATLKVYHKGRELPLYLSVQGANKFSPGDYVEFYGQGNSGDSTYFDPYTDTNVYWLTWGGEPGLRMKTRSSLIDSATEVTEYLERIHLEQDNFYYHGDNSLDLINTEQVSGEGWVWRTFYPGESEIVTLPVTSVAESNYPGRLKIKLRGTTLDPISPDHHAKVFLNDNFLGEIYFDDTEESLFEISFPNSSLREGENRLVLTSIGDTGAERDQFYLDWIELEYPRQLVAQNNHLEFTASNEIGTAKFSPWSFSDPNIQLFDLTTHSVIENTAVTAGLRFFFKAISAGYNDGNFAKLYINSQEVVSYGHRGHNLAVVDEISGQLIETKYFDTHLSTAEADSMAHYIQNLPQGRIVLVAINDEGSRNMTEVAYLALESLGSQLARSVGYRDSWAMIGRKGAPVGSVPEELKTSGSGIASVKDTLILAGSGQSYYLVFGDTVRQTKTYLAVAQNGVKYPVAAKLDTNGHLTSPGNGADLIIIAHKKFLKSAQRLAQYRATHNGLRVKVVDVEDIYDEFN